MNELTSGYYAPLDIKKSFNVGAWNLFVGKTPDGKWVIEYHSAASSRYQRQYFDTSTEAYSEARRFTRGSKAR